MEKGEGKQEVMDVNTAITDHEHQQGEIQGNTSENHPLEILATTECIAPSTEIQSQQHQQQEHEHEHEHDHEHDHEQEQEHHQDGDDEHTTLLPNTVEPIKEKKDKDKEKDKKKKKKDKDKDKEKAVKESLSPAADETTSLLPKSASPKTSTTDTANEIHAAVESAPLQQDPSHVNNASYAVQTGTTAADFMGVAAAQDLEKGEKKKKEKEKEKEKDEKKKGPKDDDIKTHMANERTFFKWLFFGFHIGAMGTFVLTFFSANTPGRVYMVAGVWVIAFFFVYYGLFRYFARRRALRLGLTSPTDWDDPAGPALMAGAMFLIVIAIVIFAILTDSVPTKGGWKHDEPGLTSPGDGSDTNPAEPTPLSNDTDLIPIP